MPENQSQGQDITSNIPDAFEAMKKAYTNTADFYGGMASKAGQSIKQILGQGVGETKKIGTQTVGATKQVATDVGGKARAAAGIVEPSQEAWQNKVITDRQRTTEENRALDNPFQASDWKGKTEAVGGLLQRLNADETYQKMNAHQRVDVRSKFYDDTLVPMFQQAGQKPPSKKDWLMQTRYDTQMPGLAEDYLRALGTRGLKYTVAGAKLGRSEWAAAYGLADYFHGDTAFDFDASIKKGEYQAERSLYGKFVGALQVGLNQNEFFLNSRPRDSMLSSMAVMAGDQTAMLPIYLLTGGVLGKAAGIATDIATSSEGLSGLTETLSSSPTGQWIGRRLLNAADGYLSSTMSGDTQKEALQSGAGLAAFGAVAEPVGKYIVKPGWETLIKKITGNNIAVGGEVLQHELTDSAIAEANGSGHGIKDVPDKGVSATEYRDSGHFVTKDGEVHPYNNVEEKAKLKDHLRGEAYNVRSRSDQINHSLHEAEKKVLNDISMYKYGKPFAKLARSAQQDIATIRARFTMETAQELPVHAPDSVKREAQAEIDAIIKNNPIAGKHLADLKAAGVDVSQLVTDNRVETAAAQTGLTDPIRVAEKVGAVSPEAEEWLAKRAEFEKELKAAHEKAGVGEETSLQRSQREYLEGKARKRAAQEAYEKARREYTGPPREESYWEKQQREFLEGKRKKREAIEEYERARRGQTVPSEEPPPTGPPTTKNGAKAEPTIKEVLSPREEPLTTISGAPEDVKTASNKEMYIGIKEGENLESRFKIQSPTKGGVRLFGDGIYLADEPAYAQQYGKPVKSTFTGNYKEMTRKEFNAETTSDEFYDFMKSRGADEDASEKRYMADYFKSKGYDAIHIHEPNDPTNQWVVYNPETLKAHEELSSTLPGDIEYEPSEGESANVTMDEYAGYKDEVKAFYRNRSERLDSRGRIIGARDQRTVGERLKDRNKEAFVDLLRDIDGDVIPFENDNHRMEYHYGFRQSMEPKMRAKLVRRLKQAFPGEGAQQFAARSRRTLRHARDLVKGGQIAKGEAFWNSTRSTGWHTKWTKQQRTEVAALSEVQIKKNVNKFKKLVQRSKGAKQMLDSMTNFLGME